MTVEEWINTLSVIVLVLFVVALIYLIVLLHRANRIVGRVDNVTDTFRSFVADVIPAIVNVGTVASAAHGVLKGFLEHRNETTKTKKKK